MAAATRTTHCWTDCWARARRQNVATAREITGSGALALTEQEIAASTDEALRPSVGLILNPRSGLINLAVLATQQESETADNPTFASPRRFRRHQEGTRNHASNCPPWAFGQPALLRTGSAALAQPQDQPDRLNGLSDDQRIQLTHR